MNKLKELEKGLNLVYGFLDGVFASVFGGKGLTFWLPVTAEATFLALIPRGIVDMQFKSKVPWSM